MVNDVFGSIRSGGEKPKMACAADIIRGVRREENTKKEITEISYESLRAFACTQRLRVATRV
jgi:hypothetical protein